MKVLHLPYGIGIGTLSKALRRQGIEAASCSFKSNRYAYMADKCLALDDLSPADQAAVREAYFHEAMETYDIFHLHFGESFFSDGRDLPILTSLGKKLIVHHRGSEARILPIARSAPNRYVRVKRTWSESGIRARLARLSAYAQHVIIPDREMLPYVSAYYRHVHIIPHAIDCEAFTPQYPAPAPVEMPLVVHAPSHRGVKGTEYVLAAVRRLQRRGVRFRFQLVEGMSHDEAKRLYSQATIIIDQLRIGSYANLSMEAMALGKPVICYIRDDLRRRFPPELPIVNANPDTIYDVLGSLLAMPEQWALLGRQGTAYVKRYHHADDIARSLIKLYHKL